MKHIDYAKVSQYLKEWHECDKILIDFLELEGKMVIHKHSFRDGKLIIGQKTSYDYSSFENITERLERGELQNPVDVLYELANEVEAL